MIVLFFISLISFADFDFYETEITTSSDSLSAKTLIFDELSGTESEPHDLFIPIKTTSTSDAPDHSLLSDIPLVDSSLTDDPFITLVFEISDEVTTNIYIAVKKSDGNFETLGNTIEVDTLEKSSLSISFEDICTVGSCSINSGSSTISEDQVIYIFQSTSSLAEGTSIDPESDDFSNGEFIELHFDSQFDTSNAPIINTSSIGDEQVFLNFSEGEVPSTFTKFPFQLVVYKLTTNIGGGFSLADVLINDPNVSLDEKDAQTSGNVTVKNLTNGEVAILSIALVNKFQFLTISSNVVEETPQNLEMFLEEKQCYFLSAAFQKDHFVLEYFRHIRDSLLLKFSLGKKLVNLYYATAPSFTPYIISSSFLQLFIQFFSYLGYFFFKFYLFLLIPIIYIMRKVR